VDGKFHDPAVPFDLKYMVLSLLASCHCPVNINQGGYRSSVNGKKNISVLNPGERCGLSFDNLLYEDALFLLYAFESNS